MKCKRCGSHEYTTKSTNSMDAPTYVCKNCGADWITEPVESVYEYEEPIMVDEDTDED